jgi:hypothetical protein
MKFKAIPPPRKFCHLSLLAIIILIIGFISCQKQELRNEPNAGLPIALIWKDKISTIDNPQQSSFFIKNRPNPDAPVKESPTPNNNIQLLNNGNKMEYTDEIL